MTSMQPSDETPGDNDRYQSQMMQQASYYMDSFPNSNTISTNQNNNGEVGVSTEIDPVVQMDKIIVDILQNNKMFIENMTMGMNDEIIANHLHSNQLAINDITNGRSRGDSDEGIDIVTSNDLIDNEGE